MNIKEISHEFPSKDDLRTEFIV